MRAITKIILTNLKKNVTGLAILYGTVGPKKKWVSYVSTKFWMMSNNRICAKFSQLIE